MVREEEAFNYTGKDNNLHLLVGLERRDDLIRLWDRLRTKMLSGG